MFFCPYTFPDVPFQDADNLILFTKIDADYQTVIGYPYRCINNTSDYTLNGFEKCFARYPRLLER